MKYLRSEEEITRTWANVSGNPVVSICCNTYNHEHYIEDAIEGFLAQETDFPFEILIHDDASTDGTAAIIKYYESTYPQIVRAIYQKSNQYSKGVRISATYLLPKARGEYLALCEGDDYWTHPAKLARQLAAIREHDVDLVFNPSVTEIFSGHEIIGRTNRYGCCGGSQKKVFLDDVFRKGGGAIPAASIFIKKEALFGVSGEYSAFLKDCLTHFYWQVLGTMRAGAIYLPEYMSVYRRGRIGSWTQRNSNPEKWLSNSIDFLNRLKRFDSVTQHKYHHLVRDLRFRKMVAALRLESVASRDKDLFFGEVGAGRAERFMVSSMLLALDTRARLARVIRCQK